jgi:hypothetical protein
VSARHSSSTMSRRCPAGITVRSVPLIVSRVDGSGLKLMKKLVVVPKRSRQLRWRYVFGLGRLGDSRHP